MDNPNTPISPKNLKRNSTDFVNFTKYPLMIALLPKHQGLRENQIKKKRRADPGKVYYGKF
jgi:hypothetical protein